MTGGKGGLYETIDLGYGRVRRPDPRIKAHIDAALGEAATVVNVGAGTGSYEPADRRVVAVEPAQVMLAQRAATAAPAVRAVAEALPFGDLMFDAALAVSTVHHWHDLAKGLGELRRVARRQVVFFNEPEVAASCGWSSTFPRRWSCLRRCTHRPSPTWRRSLRCCGWRSCQGCAGVDVGRSSEGYLDAQRAAHMQRDARIDRDQADTWSMRCPPITAYISKPTSGG